jgi:antitoxin component YwqK of YwqJK toxin-antitoxin module
MNPEDYNIVKEGTTEKWYSKETNDLRKLIEYWPNGNKFYESYWLNGKRHREDGPARQGWYENGTKQREIYYLNGKYHREDGPAYQSWYENGTKDSDSDSYWLNDTLYSKEDYIAIMLAKKFELI